MNYLQLFGALLLSLQVLTTQAAETTTFYHLDPSGTPLIATNSTGAVQWKEVYRPFGVKLTNAAASSQNSIGYAGKPYDNTTGLSYMGARYYHPVLGRFMGVDPKGYDTSNIHSFNRYAYANNNPYKYLDPDGRSPVDVAFLAYDVGKLGVALYTGVGIGHAAADVALSLVGVASPVPGTGQALKAARTTHQLIDASKAVEHAAEVGLGAGQVAYKRYTPGGKFSKATKEETAERAAYKCEYCGVETVAAKKSERGVTPPKNETQTDHIVPRSEGGTNSPTNAAHSCRDCNRQFSNLPKNSPRVD